MIFLRALRVSFVLLSRIFLFFEQDFVYKLLFSQRSLRLCGELLFVFWLRLCCSRLFVTKKAFESKVNSIGPDP